MKTFHEWLAERTATQSEGLWLNDKLARAGPVERQPAEQVEGREAQAGEAGHTQATEAVQADATGDVQGEAS